MADEGKVLFFYLNERLELVKDVKDTAIIRKVELDDDGRFSTTHYMVGPLEPLEEPTDAIKEEIKREKLPVEVEKAGVASLIGRFGEKINAKLTRAVLRRLAKKEKQSLVRFFGREVQRLKGQEGYWITVRGGNRIFIPLGGITGGAVAGGAAGAIAGKAAGRRQIKEGKKITERAKENKK